TRSECGAPRVRPMFVALVHRRSSISALEFLATGQTREVEVWRGGRFTGMRTVSVVHVKNVHQGGDPPRYRPTYLALRSKGRGALAFESPKRRIGPRRVLSPPA